MERVTRIELALSAWEADVLPLNYTRDAAGENQQTGGSYLSPEAVCTGGNGGVFHKGRAQDWAGRSTSGRLERVAGGNIRRNVRMRSLPGPDKMVAGQLKRRGEQVATETNDALENLEKELVTLARRLRGLQRTLSDEAHPDLEPAQYALLNHVEELAPVRMADLVSALEVDKGPVSRACARLEEEGLLKRAADKSDARATLLTLTANGKRKLAAARKKRHKVIEDLLKDWSPAQVKTFATQVSKFNKLSG